MVICLQRGADLHMAQLMPLPLTVSCFSNIQIGFSFLVPAHPGSPGQRAIKRLCVKRLCVVVIVIVVVVVIVARTPQIYTMFPNKKDINLTAVTALILNRFSIFFHYQIVQ